MTETEATGITIGALAGAGRHLIAECADCGHSRKIPADRIDLLPETSVANAGKHMRCTACRGKKILTMAESMRDARKGIER